MLDRLFEYMDSIVRNDGPSATKWVYVRTSEIISFGWSALVLAQVYRFVRFGTTDGALLTLIGSLAAALFAATSLNQNTKLTLDARAAGNPSTISTPGGSVTSGESKNDDARA